MTETVTSLFHSEQHALAAAASLETAGIPRDKIDIWSTPHNLATLLQDGGVSRSDAHAYAEGVIRGGTVIIVSCDRSEVDQVVAILDREGVLDLDEQQASWRSEDSPERAASVSASRSNESYVSADADTGAGNSLAEPPDRNPTDTGMTSADGSHEIGHGRVRIQSRKSRRPPQQ
jgi:hypothetical protein